MRTADNRLVFGGRARHALSDPASDMTSGANLRASLAATLPQLREAGIDYCWGGLVDMPPDHLPRAWRTARRRQVATSTARKSLTLVSVGPVIT